MAVAVVTKVTGFEVVEVTSLLPSEADDGWILSYVNEVSMFDGDTVEAEIVVGSREATEAADSITEFVVSMRTGGVVMIIIGCEEEVKNLLPFCCIEVLGPNSVGSEKTPNAPGSFKKVKSRHVSQRALVGCAATLLDLILRQSLLF